MIGLDHLDFMAAAAQAIQALSLPTLWGVGSPPRPPF